MSLSEFSCSELDSATLAALPDGVYRARFSIKGVHMTGWMVHYMDGPQCRNYLLQNWYIGNRPARGMIVELGGSAALEQMLSWSVVYTPAEGPSFEGVCGREHVDYIRLVEPVCQHEPCTEEA